MSKVLHPFYFMIVFWGEEFRKYFTEFCLPSLLSENNLPAFEFNPDNRFLICTTAADWEALQNDPAFQNMASQICPELIEMSSPEPDELKMLVMSRGHKQLIERAFSDRAYGIYLAPEIILADGYGDELMRLARAGKKVVVTGTVRFEFEAIKIQLEQRGLLNDGAPITLTPRELVSIGCSCLHSATLATDWSADYFSDFPVHCYWAATGKDGILVYTHAWVPLLMSYADLATHDTTTLDDWTIDGDYLHKNFKDLRVGDDFHVIDDSDDLMLLGLTPKNDTRADLEPHWSKRLPVIGDWTKGFLVRNVYFNSVIDPLKREIFLTPMKYHSNDLDDEWKKLERRSLNILKDYVSETCLRASVYDSSVKAIRRSWYYFYFKPYVFWHYLKPYLDVIFRATKGDRVERKRIVRRARIILVSLTSRAG